MDPFSLTVGTLGIAGAAIQSINALIHEIKAIKDAPGVVESLRYELAAVEATLLALDNAHKSSKLDHLTPDVREALQLAVMNCQKACDNFGIKLAGWTKRSDEKMHWWDRVRVGFLAETTVKALCDQLNRCESTMSTAVSTATLFSTTTSYPTGSAMQSDLSTKETEIAQEIIDIDNQRALSGMALQKIEEGRLLDDPQDSAEVIEQLQDQRAALDGYRKLLAELLVEAHHVRTGQTITNIDMSDGGRLLIGLINCDDNNGEVRQEIHNVKATNHGKGVVGMAKGFDVNAFFNN